MTDEVRRTYLQTDPFTLSAWILSRQHITVPHARGHLTVLLNAICVGCKFISTAVRRAGVAGNDVLGQAGSSNVQGEDQKKLDVVANDVFKNVLRKSGQCAVLVTEEEEDPILIEEPYRGDYCVVFDPLDGSSNIECGVSIGTIFGIYKVKEGSSGSINDVLRVSFACIVTILLCHSIGLICTCLIIPQSAGWKGDGSCWILYVWFNDLSHAYYRSRCGRIHSGHISGRICVDSP